MDATKQSHHNYYVKQKRAVTLAYGGMNFLGIWLWMMVIITSFSFVMTIISDWQINIPYIAIVPALCGIALSALLEISAFIMMPRPLFNHRLYKYLLKNSSADITPGKTPTREDVITYLENHGFSFIPFYHAHMGFSHDITKEPMMYDGKKHKKNHRKCVFIIMDGMENAIDLFRNNTEELTTLFYDKYYGFGYDGKIPWMNRTVILFWGDNVSEENLKLCREGLLGHSYDKLLKELEHDSNKFSGYCLYLSYMPGTNKLVYADAIKPFAKNMYCSFDDITNYIEDIFGLNPPQE